MSASLLLCGHTVYFDPIPEPGDRVYCRRCIRYTVVKVAAEEWGWKCTSCPTGRRFGADEQSARGSARRHQRKYHHVVLVKHGIKTMGTVGPEGQGEMSVAGERITWLANHHGTLRAAVEKRIIQNGQSTVEHQP